MTIFVYGSKTARTFENKMLRAFHQRLLTQWSGQDRNITLIANSLWNGAEIDLVCLTANGVLLVDFKDYMGHVTGTENGPWKLDGEIEIRGGSKRNPFHQLRDNKFAMMAWLNGHSLLASRSLGNIGAAVVFKGPITQNLDLPPKISRWFQVTDFNSCSDTLADFSAPDLSVYERDIAAIVEAAGVEPMADISGSQASPEKSWVNTNLTPPMPTGAPPKVSSSGGPQREAELEDSSTSQSATPHSPVVARKRPLALVYVAVAAIVVTASIAFTPLLMRESRGNDKHEEQIERRPLPTPQVEDEATSTPGDEAASPPRVEANKAPFYVGRTVLACGKLAGAKPFKKGIYLSLDKPFPKETLTILIWDRHLPDIRSKFGRLDDLKNRQFCALGEITEYRKHLRLEIENPHHLRLMQ